MSLAVLSVLLLLAAAGCDSTPETLLDSDVPQIVGMEARHLSGIERSGDRLVGARALYRGELTDPEPLARQMIARFSARGWTPERKRISTTSATLLFVKDEREVEVDLKGSQLNPAMGIGSIDVRRRHGATVGGAGGGIGGTAAPASSSGGRS